MQSFLCAEFIDFSDIWYGTSPESLGVPACDPASCPGPEHVRVWAEMIAGQTGESAGALLRRFGTSLFGRLIRRYPAFLVGIESTLDLVGRYEGHIAAEVQKLNDSARLPNITMVRKDGEPVDVIYHSTRGLADLAEGLLLGSIAYFGEPFILERREAASGDTDHAVFRLLTQTAR
jgi:hypothetical protein